MVNYQFRLKTGFYFDFSKTRNRARHLKIRGVSHDLLKIISSVFINILLILIKH